MALSTLIRLAWLLLRGLLLRAIGRPSRGLAAFTAGYCDEDRLLPLTPHEHEALASYSRCIGCGLCDAHFDAYAEVARPEFNGPSALPLSYSRSLGDAAAVGPYLANLDRGDVERLERLCPTGVPLVALARMTRRLAEATRPEAPADAPRPRHDPG